MAVLATVDLVKNYGRVPAVRGVSLTVNDRELLCILGPSGCGKSTTLRVIGGFEQADGGDVRLDGASIAALPPNRRPTAMVFQRYTLWPHMRVFDNVAFGLRLRHLSKATIAQKVGAVLELVGLPHAGRRYPHQLSGGEQQRIALARALVLEPRVLLLDEPLSNLDARLRVRMREEIKRIQQRVGITSVFVTHDQEEALSVADRIAVMNGGRLEQVDTPTAVYGRPQTLFVADFIGRMNLLEAPYRRDRRALQTEIGLLPAPEGAAWRDGAALVVAIRPEDLRLAQPDDALACCAQVEVVMDLGHYRQASLRISPGTTLTMIAGKGVDLQPGESVTVAPTRYLVYVQPTTAADEAPGAGAVDTAPPVEVFLPAVQRLAL
jgi:ABC-type Fe3+/spermidine/putrescine transport system ATPase subunit